MRIRLLLTLGALIAAVLLAPTHAGAQEGVATFVSNPKLKPPELVVNRASRGQAPGYVFAALFKSPFSQAPMAAQPGAVILDSRGRYVWFKPVKQANEAANLQVQRYRGKPVLTYWDGELVSGIDMKGTWYVLNDRYRTIARLTSQDGYIPSVHEFFITRQNTALTTYYRHIPNRDLRAVGGGESQTLVDSGVAEYDLGTGKLLRTWSPEGRIPMEDSFVPARPPAPYDPWHINSIDVDADGNWLLSMRNTHAIYKVNPTTGAIVWTLGGKRSTFALGDRAKFAFQHDARFMPDGQISMFDNNCCGNPTAAVPEPVHEKQSRGLVLKLDENAKTATRVKEQTLYDLVAGTQANYQLLPNGNSFIGWGQQPFLSEHSKAGRLLLAVRFTDPATSYRAYRYAWKGRPAGRPLAAARPSGSRTRVYVSWNGATEVAAYRVLGGPTSRRLRVVAKRVRQGFETSALVRSAGPVFRIQALDAKGRVLATSRPVRRQNTTGNAPSPTY